MRDDPEAVLGVQEGLRDKTEVVNPIWMRILQTSRITKSLDFASICDKNDLRLYACIFHLMSVFVRITV